MALKFLDNIKSENVRLTLDGSGIKAVNENGNALGSQQAFWFAWSQSHRDTALWPESQKFTRRR